MKGIKQIFGKRSNKQMLSKAELFQFWKSKNQFLCNFSIFPFLGQKYPSYAVLSKAVTFTQFWYLSPGIVSEILGKKWQIKNILSIISISPENLQQAFSTSHSCLSTLVISEEKYAISRFREKFKKEDFELKNYPTDLIWPYMKRYFSIKIGLFCT